MIALASDTPNTGSSRPATPQPQPGPTVTPPRASTATPTLAGGAPHTLGRTQGAPDLFRRSPGLNSAPQPPKALSVGLTGQCRPCAFLGARHAIQASLHASRYSHTTSKSKQHSLSFPEITTGCAAEGVHRICAFRDLGIFATVKPPLARVRNFFPDLIRCRFTRVTARSALRAAPDHVDPEVTCAVSRN